MNRSNMDELWFGIQLMSDDIPAKRIRKINEF